MTITLRPGRDGDAPTITELQAVTARVAYAHIFPPAAPFPLDETRRRWETFRGQLVVAEAGPRAIGFAAFEGQELHALYVLPEYWGTGVGERLLHAAGGTLSPVERAERAPGNGVHPGELRTLWVLRENRRARRFYEKHGWVADGTARLAYGVVELRYRRLPRSRSESRLPAVGVPSRPAAGSVLTGRACARNRCDR
ncbi:MAG TPA: GNAT family N-acetyltransferase [Chloroflexota bacterium]|nr:GNAT family N-acetyltransferase [Chloroflexota bacterium]